jgi:hypothetical protein
MQTSTTHLAASAPKTRRRRPAPALGDIWFAKLPNSEQLATVRIDELTEFTVVLFLESDSNVSYRGVLGRYVRREINFVERVSTAPETPQCPSSNL